MERWPQRTSILSVSLQKCKAVSHAVMAATIVNSLKAKKKKTEKMLLSLFTSLQCCVALFFLFAQWRRQTDWKGPDLIFTSC